MCGIVGYIGNKNAEEILVDGLTRLEYRGYDSAGIAVLGEAGFSVFKTKGRVKDLEDKINGHELKGNLGIAHTRWATHGEPSDVNAHPHCDDKGQVYLVHNGIIENYRQLKEELISEGHVFVSATDSEVLAHLIARELEKERSLVKAVRKALRLVIGAYGIAVVAKDYPGVLVVARLGSPLVIGRGEGENIVASDVTAILPTTREVIYLNDGEIAEVTASKITVSDLDARIKRTKSEKVDWSLEEASKGGFEHYMLKEIYEAPDAVKNSMRGRLDFANATAKLGGLEDVSKRLSKVKHITMVGMGTARLAAMVGEYMLEEYARIPVEVEFAGEYTYKQQPNMDGGAILAVSQSGETADTLLAVKEAKRKGVLSLGIVNVIASSIARETDAGVYNHIGPEVAVASTKAFISQLTILTLFTLFLGRQRDMSVATAERIMKELKGLPEKTKGLIAGLDEAIKVIADKYKDKHNFFFLGRKYNYPVALEGALKLKEVAYVHAEGYNAAEMKHGPIALLEKDFPVIVIAPSDSVYEKNLSHIQEVKVRGARVIAIATEGNEEIKELVDDVIYIPRTLEMLTPILSVIPLQLFAYYVAVARGADVDKPRNLAKSVTVE